MVPADRQSSNSSEPGARLSRSDWLAAALALVSRRGVEGLKVQELAASLGSSTGSLYWHFENRRALLDALLDYWVEASTEVIAQRVERTEASAQEHLLQLRELVFENEATSGDIAIRAWAAFDATAEKAVARADERRAAVVGGLLAEMGFSAEECAMRTRVLLCYESCERFVFTRTSRAERARLRELRHAMLCGH